ncbi:MAG: 6-phosphogluconolactonase [Bacteroidales bacterium]
MERILKISQNLLEMSREAAADLSNIVNRYESQNRRLSIALSGGNTPKTFFSVLGTCFAGNTSWEFVDFYWSDEHCVPPDDRESNYRIASETFLDKIKISPGNIHRIKGEKNPEVEAVRYSGEIRRRTFSRFGLPVFDIVFLGLGEDGHIASIFPRDEHVLNSREICEVATHPVTGQKRITLTLPVINNAKRVIFMVSGRGKAEIVADILNNREGQAYPACIVNPRFGKLYWYLDFDASSLLSQLA